MLRSSVLLAGLRAARLTCRSEHLYCHGQRRQRHVRHQCTKNPSASEQPEIGRFLAARKEDLIRDVYVTETGEELLTVDADADLDGNIDWADFERRFGLNNADDDAVDEGWERLQRKYRVRTERIDDKPFGGAKRAGASRNKHTRFGLKGRKYTDIGFSVEYCDEEPPEAQLENAQIKTEHSPREKSGPFQYAAVEHQNCGPKNVETELFSDAHIFQQPVNRKRPGYERRVMSMERELEKIAVDVLCGENSQWYAEGAEIERVLLSPNMKNLTVYYNLDEGTTRPASWWRKTNAKTANSVRAAFAERLETKYVPRVYLEQVTKEESDGTIGQKQELDVLFDQIAAERTENSQAKKDLDSKITS